MNNTKDNVRFCAYNHIVFWYFLESYCLISSVLNRDVKKANFAQLGCSRWITPLYVISIYDVILKDNINYASQWQIITTRWLMLISSVVIDEISNYMLLFILIYDYINWRWLPINRWLRFNIMLGPHTHSSSISSIYSPDLLYFFTLYVPQ